MANQNILNLLGQFGGGQSQPLQSPAGFVQQQQGVKLPPYITPTTPTPRGGSPFGDMSDKLDSKSQGLALMLYALGGALKGDKDFVQNTLALQQMQEGKKKQEEQKKKYEEFLAKLPDGSFKDLATALGPSKLDDLLLERYKAEQPKEMDIGDYKAYLANKILNKIPLTTEDKELEAYLKNLDALERLKMGLPRARGGEISQPSPKSYSSVEAVEEDYRAGILKIGDTVSLNGLELEVDPKAFEL
jgi:hypothetical protein